MRTTTETAELSLDELALVSGADAVSGHTGPINFGSGTKSSYVSWPGAVGGMNGTWTMSSQSGLTWHPA